MGTRSNDARAREKEAAGEAAYIEQTGRAAGAEVLAIGLARAESYERQVAALGQSATALVNAVDALSRCTVPFVPQVLVTGSGGGAIEGLAATLTSFVRGGGITAPSAPVAPRAESPAAPAALNPPAPDTAPTVA